MEETKKCKNCTKLREKYPGFICVQLRLQPLEQFNHTDSLKSADHFNASKIPLHIWI